MTHRVRDWLKGEARLARSLFRWGALPYHALRREQRPGVVVLLYHRVGGSTRSEIDVAVGLFERQMDYLRRHVRVVSLDDVVRISMNGSGPPAQRDVVAITFDDGHQGTYHLAYPILHRYSLPATIYVPAMYLEARRPFDFGAYRAMDPAERPRPLTWDQLAEMGGSGLMTIGAHTHTHADLSRLSLEEARRELDECDRLIEARLGFRPKHFAYPWGRWAPATHALVASRYDTVALGGPAKNPYRALDLSRMWRYPVIQSDGFWLFRARLRLLTARDGFGYDRLDGDTA
ncbi:MAG: polysaccharide deacetylase family protein [bacterium]